MITTHKPLTAIDTLKRELNGVQILQELCINDYGIIINSKRVEYQELVAHAKKLKWSIDHLEGMRLHK